MSNFRIIAIKTGGPEEIMQRNFRNSATDGFDITYLKNLKENWVYSFYKHFTFPKNDFLEINYEPKNDLDLYSIELSNGKKLHININAIVGENGSGKSTLTELLYWMNYNLGCKFELLENQDGEKYLIHGTLDLQILYSVDIDSYYIIKFENGSISKRKIEFTDNKYHEKGDLINFWSVISSIDDLSDFFYTLVVNYSQYSLNDLEIGEWVNPLFHKNDGYQTPIVLNPMRINGNINVNREIQLLSRRLQANVLEPLISEEVKSLRNLANGKIAKILEVTYNPSYIKKLEEKGGGIDQILYKETIEGIKKHFDIELIKGDEIYNEFVTHTTKYVYFKLKKIVYNYPVYQQHRKIEIIKVDGGTQKINSIIDIDKLLLDIKNSNSHIVFKIKGAILHLKYYKDIYRNQKSYFDESFSTKIDDLSVLIENIAKKEIEFIVNTYMMSFPSFFKVEVIPDNNLTISGFSSGEKQRINSMNSIVYHLINLNSVEEQKLKKGGKFTSYRYINMVLDEIELYYHPEWQRMYVNDLLEYIKKINPQNLKNIKGLNIMLITHSPYILSDIPLSNILKLEDGEPKETEENKQTFGANIHELLTDSFFMKNGFVGEFADKVITSLISIIKVNDKKFSEEESEKLLRQINIIGEPFIRSKLLEMLLSKTDISEDERIKKKIKIKQEEITRLERQLKQ